MGRISSIAKAIIVGRKFWVFFVSFLFIFSAIGAEGWSIYNAVESFVEVHLSNIFGKAPCVMSVWLTQLSPGSTYSLYYFSQFLDKHNASYFAHEIFGNASLAPFRLNYGYVMKGGAVIKIFKNEKEHTLVYTIPPVVYLIVNDSSPYYLYLCHRAGASKGEPIVLTYASDLKGVSNGTILCSSNFTYLAILSGSENPTGIPLQNLTERKELPAKIFFVKTTSSEFWRSLLLGLTPSEVNNPVAFIVIPSHYFRNLTSLGAPNLYYLTINGGITSLEELIKLWNLNKIVKKNLKDNFKNFAVNSIRVITPNLNVKSPPLEIYNEMFSVPPSWSSTLFIGFMKKYSIEGFSILLTYSLMIASLSCLIILLLTLISRRKMKTLLSLGASSNLIALSFSLSILGVAAISLIIVGIFEIFVIKVPPVIYLEYLSLPQLAFIGLFSYLFVRYNLRAKELRKWSSGAVWVAVLLFVGASIIAIWELPSQGIAKKVEILQLFIVIAILCSLLALSLIRGENKKPWKRSKILLLVKGALGKETVLGIMAIIVAASASSALYLEGPIFMSQKANELSWFHLMCDLKITGPFPSKISEIVSKFGGAFITYYPLNNLLYLIASSHNNTISGVIPINLTQLKKICALSDIPKYEKELFQRIAKYLSLGPYVGLEIEPGKTWSEQRVIKGNYTIYYTPEGAPTNLPHLHLKIYEITCPPEIYAIYSKLFFSRGTASPAIIRYSDFRYLEGNVTEEPSTVYYVFFKGGNVPIDQIKKELSQISGINFVFREEFVKKLLETYMREEGEILQEIYLFLLYVSAVVVMITLNIGKALRTRIDRIENIGMPSNRLSSILAASIAISSAIGVILALAPIMVATPWILKSTFSLYLTFVEYPVKFSFIIGVVALVSSLLTFYEVSRRRSDGGRIKKRKEILPDREKQS